MDKIDINHAHFLDVEEELDIVIPRFVNDAAGRKRRRAEFWRAPDANGCIKCVLCPRGCLIPEGKLGFCRTRQNKNGVLLALNYGWLRAMNVEKIENIPMAEWHFGESILAAGSYGCNLHCPSCSSYQLLQQTGTGRFFNPLELAEVADMLRERGNVGLAFTFTEPMASFEYTLDSLASAKKYGLETLISTNGMVEELPYAQMLSVVDAVNIDIKSLKPSFYEGLGGSLECVIDRAAQTLAAGVHLEISRLVMPGVNDSPTEIRALAQMIADNFGKHIPLHLIMHQPTFDSSIPQTTEEELVMAADIADRYLDNVYISQP